MTIRRHVGSVSLKTGRTLGLLTVLGSALALMNPANAVVLQIDGQVVPATNAITDGLCRGENGLSSADPTNPANYTGCPVKAQSMTFPKTNGTIDYILEASEFPQVFAIPKDNSNNYGTVTFVDLQEGAGFENTFGWYNVGDDLTDLRNLHPVLTCMNTNYEPVPSATSIRSVNFQTEYQNYITALQSNPSTTVGYKGGFVGFFLVTPEGKALSDDVCNGTTTGQCGNPEHLNGSNLDGQCVGRIYYTQKEINGDGNYVHYLVYQTKVLDAPGPTDPPTGKRRNDYYFGFEDLYRGGDNDFEDMLILVRGLVVPCTPSPEICDGIDNNCDGIVDDNDNDPNNGLVTTDTGDNGPDCAGNGGSYQTVPPNAAPAYWGIGTCKPGKLVCNPGGVITCAGEVVPSTEICDGLDNNCDSFVDNGINNANLPSADSLCPTKTVGNCDAIVACIAATAQCVVTQGPTVEVCNGVDDDCDGLIDETDLEDPNTPMVDVGGPCGSSVGVCELGTYECQNGMRVCVGGTGPAMGDPCDGLDNDCDGFVDEDVYPEVGQPCGGGGMGTCSEEGVFQCIGGIVCVTDGGVSSPEICDGIDNDCDGQIDEAPTLGEGAQCFQKNPAGQPLFPPCSTGTLVCKDNNGTKELICEFPANAVTPIDELCNLVDDDCDGKVDETDDPMDPSNDGVVGTGGDCPPEGMTLDQITGACKAGKLRCARVENGPGPDDDTAAILCVGAIGPAAQESCNGIDDNCDGEIDNEAICPASLICIEGVCTKSCKQGEFSDCPGGYECKAGFCKPITCDPACQPDEYCDPVTKECKPLQGTGGNGGSNTGGSSAGGSSSGGDSGSGGSNNAGTAGSSANAGTAGSSASSGASGNSGSSAASGSSNNTSSGKDVFGQATGGGGCSTSSSPANSAGFSMTIMALLAGITRRWRNKKSTQPGSKQSPSNQGEAK